MQASCGPLVRAAVGDVGVGRLEACGCTGVQTKSVADRRPAILVAFLRESLARRVSVRLQVDPTLFIKCVRRCSRHTSIIRQRTCESNAADANLLEHRCQQLRYRAPDDAH
eukprot:1832230-Lingulodinium_polyedra.AAC.1